MNGRLAAFAGTDPATLGVWEHYLDRWTLLNTLRTAGALSAALLFTAGLVQHGR